MRASEGSILVHCQGDADRNPFFLSAYAMDDTWEAFEKATGLDS